MQPYVQQFLAPAVYDRIARAMTFREGDRVPIWDYIDNKALLDHFARPGDSLEAKQIRAYHALEIDLCRGYGGSKP